MKYVMMFLALFFSVAYAEDMMQKSERKRIVAAPPKNEIWIDVRTLAEYEKGHLEIARNIPHEKIVEEVNALQLSKDMPINIYYRDKECAETALQALQEAGYSNVTNRGTYEELIKN